MSDDLGGWGGAEFVLAADRLDTPDVIEAADPGDMLRQVASVSASTFSRSSGSVLDGRKLNHQVPVLTVSPSSSSVLTPGRPANARLTCSVEAAWSATSELISPLATYLAYLASSCDNGRGCSPRAASVCSAARSPESANQKSLK